MAAIKMQQEYIFRTVYQTKDGLRQECQVQSAMHLPCLTNDPQQSSTLIKNDQLINLRIIQSQSLITASKVITRVLCLAIRDTETAASMFQNFSP